MTTKAAIESGEWIERARSLSPLIEQWRDEGEAQRRLPVPVFQAMQDAGLFGLWTPTRFGGTDVDIETSVRVVEEIARMDGAAAWNLFVGGTAGRLAEFLPADGAEELFDGGRSVIAGSFAPNGQATPVPRGFRLSGHWTFGSGTHQANWIVAGANIVENGQQVLKEDGEPARVLCFVPQDEARILDTWFTTGLRGTGSHDFELTDAFVPESRQFNLEYMFRPPEHLRSARYEFMAVARPCMAAVGLGIARDALDSFKALVMQKTPYGGSSPLLGYHTVHEKIGRAEAMLGAARAYLYDAVRQVVANAGDESRAEDMAALIRLAGAHAAETAAEIATMMFTAGGGSSVYAKSRLERCFRDANTVTHHIHVQPVTFEMVGQYYLGLRLQMRR